MFQEHGVSYLCALQKDYSMCNMARYMPYTMCSEIRRERLENMYINELLVLLCRAMELGVMQSEMRHPGAWIGCFARVKLGKRTLVGYYSATLSTRTCMGGKRNIEYLGKRRCPWVWRTFKGVLCRSQREWKTDGNLHNVCILPAAFSPSRYINDPRYLEGVATRRLVWEANIGPSNVEFVQNIIA